MIHPCLACGACCAFFQASFHWSETLSESFAVPEIATVAAGGQRLAMKGTELRDPHCGSLKGTVGKSVSCKIYENRPSCCRDFSASYEKGKRDLRCDKARLGKGFRPLKPEDWELPTQTAI
ncbi:MAG: YkgJ family cysteine cluster protein [Bdellovibrionaceae bacterium]|nr:YkgJ family cysteine cluster protein [Pseudobdellovibrionaceae bacterium]